MAGELAARRDPDRAAEQGPGAIADQDLARRRLRRDHRREAHRVAVDVSVAEPAGVEADTGAELDPQCARLRDHRLREPHAAAGAIEHRRGAAIAGAVQLDASRPRDLALAGLSHRVADPPLAAL